MKKRRMKQDKHGDDDLALEIIRGVTDTRKSFFWNHKEGADVVNVSRNVIRGAEVNWRKLREEEQKRFDEAKAKEVDSFLTNEMLEVCKRKGRH